MWRPSSAARGNECGLSAAMRTGGCGCWKGRGPTVAFSTWKYFPSKLKVLPFHASRMTSSASMRRP